MSIGDGPFSALGIAYPPNVGSSTPGMWAQINAQQAQDDLLAMAQAQQAGVGQSVIRTQPVIPTAPNLASRAREIFLKRMGGIRAEMKVAPEDFLQCHVYNDQVHVFYCFGGRPGVTQESIDLFPSDQLITQFRLVLT